MLSQILCSANQMRDVAEPLSSRLFKLISDRAYVFVGICDSSFQSTPRLAEAIEFIGPSLAFWFEEFDGLRSEETVSAIKNLAKGGDFSGALPIQLSFGLDR